MLVVNHQMVLLFISTDFDNLNNLVHCYYYISIRCMNARAMVNLIGSRQEGNVYVMTHSTYFIHGFMVSDPVLH